MGKGARKKVQTTRHPVPSQDKSAGKAQPWYKDRTCLLLAGLFILGLALRFLDLSRKPLWLDEASTNSLTTQPDILAVVNAASGDHHAPLHFITVWFIKFIGSSEFLLRLPSVIAGALTVVVIFFIAKELYDEDAGLIAAALLAVSPLHLYYSQEARMYGMVVLFVALAVWMFLRATRTGELRDWLFFGGACTLAFYTHFYSAFVIAAMIIGYFILRFPEFLPGRKEGDTRSFQLPHDLKNFLCGIILSAILVLPLVGSFLRQSGYFVANTFNWGLSLWDIPPATFIMFSVESEVIAVIFFCLMAAGFAMVWQRQRWLTAALLFIFIVPIITSMYLSSIIPFNVRYHLYLIVIFLSLVAVPLSWLSKKIHPNYGVPAVILALILVSTPALSTYYTEPLQEDWRTFAGNLVQATNPGDTIVPLPSYMFTPLSYYYNNATDGTVYRSFPLTEAGFRSLDNTTGSVYFVVTWDITAADPGGYSLGYLYNHTTQMAGSVNGIFLLKKVS